MLGLMGSRISFNSKRTVRNSKMGEITRGNLYDVVTDATGNPRSMSNALESSPIRDLWYRRNYDQEVSFVHPLFAAGDELLPLATPPSGFPGILN